MLGEEGGDYSRGCGTALPRDGKMRANVKCRYGSPGGLEHRVIDKPAVGDDRVLVRIHAASVNAADWHLLRRVLNLFAGLVGMPRSHVRGTDLAGHVEEVGADLTRFRPGDEVSGAGIGTLAEHAIAFEERLALKPHGLTFDQAAAIPVAGCTALQALRDNGRIGAGQRILIHGAGGSVGTFAVQVAKSLGAHVTAVSSKDNLERLLSIGADEVLDYTKEEFTQREQRYDVPLDIGANRSLTDCWRVLVPNGKLVLVSATPGLRAPL